jgi:hypothetical protein
MRAGHVALAYLAAEAIKLLAYRSQLLVNNSIGMDHNATVTAYENYDQGLKALFIKLKLRTEENMELVDRLGNESPPYSPTHLTVDELEEMEVDNISHIRKQPRLSSPGLGGDPSSFNVGRDYSSQAPRADEQRGLEQRLLEQLNAQSKGVTVIMNDDKIKDLTALTLKDLDAFRNQCRQARKNNSLFSRAKHIPPDSRVRAGINFVLRTNNLISEREADVWDLWDDEAFFDTLRPLVARREANSAIPEPQVQFVTEVDRLRLDITGSFTEVALEQSFYKAARDHNLVGQVEESDTFTKAKRKELQQTMVILFHAAREPPGNLRD